MPTNLYGPNDNFDLETSHVLPALIRKMHLAKLLSEGKIEAVLEDLKLGSEKEALNYLKSFGVSSDSVEIWGSGNPTREFLFVDDLAKGCLFLLDNYSEDIPINIGTGIEVSIKELAKQICDVVGFEGKLIFDETKPDGTPRKIMDVSKMKAMGWEYQTELDDGIQKTYNWFLENINNFKEIKL